MSPGTELSIEQLSALREKTEAVSEFLHRQLAGHVGTLQPILAPQRVFGKHIRAGARSDVRGADRAFEQLREAYAKVAVRPFGLSRELLEDPISVEGKLELSPWEYSHELEDSKSITMTSPVRWVLSYSSGYTVSELHRTFESGENRRTEDVRQFVSSACALALLLEKQTGIAELLRDLRYEVEVATSDRLGDVPLVTLSSSVRSIRPDDELIRAATRFSGVPAFIELIDVEAVRSLRDPLRARIEAILA